MTEGVERSAKAATASTKVTVEDRVNADRVEVLSEKDEEHVLDFPEQEGAPFAEVGIQLGVTKNLGDYEYARIDVSIKVPCPVSDIDQMYERAKTWVAKRVKKEVQSINSRFADEGDLR